MDWRPQPKQALFLNVDADEVLYGGAAGGGKTDALIMDAYRHCERYPGAPCLIVRRKMVDMTRPGSIIQRSQMLFAGTPWQWKEQARRWVHPNGSVIQFGQTDNDNYVIENYQGAQIEYLGIEEAGQLTGFQIDYLIGRVRPMRSGVRTKIRATANPGGPGHSYLKARYVDRDPDGTGRVWQPERGEGQTIDPPTRAYIRALVDDNPALLANMPRYLANLENLPEPLRSAYRWGKWDIFVGQFFSEWSPAVHVVDCFPPGKDTDEYGIPDWWPRIGGLDWGFNHPFYAIWARVSPEGEVYAYREKRRRFAHVDGPEGLASDLKRDDDPLRMFAAGTDIFTMQHKVIGGPTIAEDFQREGIAVTNPTVGKKRVHGWQQCRKYLQWQGPDGGRIDGRPLFKVLRGPDGKVTCPYLLKCLPEMQFSETDSEDMQRVDIDSTTGEGGDDEASAWMHLLMQRPWIGSPPPPPLPPEGSISRYEYEKKKRLKERAKARI